MCGVSCVCSCLCACVGAWLMGVREIHGRHDSRLGVSLRGVCDGQAYEVTEVHGRHDA